MLCARIKYKIVHTIISLEDIILNITVTVMKCHKCILTLPGISSDAMIHKLPIAS